METTAVAWLNMMRVSAAETEASNELPVAENPRVLSFSAIGRNQSVEVMETTAVAWLDMMAASAA